MQFRAKHRSTRSVAHALIIALCLAVVLSSAAFAQGDGTVTESSESASNLPGANATLTMDGRTLTGPRMSITDVPVGAASVSAQAIPVFSSDFETGGTWNVTGWPGWGQTSYRKSQGNLSMYCAGNAVQAPGPYPPNMESWMIAGPFDLTGYSSAAFSFDVYLDCEYDEDVWTDIFFAGSGTDGVNFDGVMYDGYSEGWQTISLPAVGLAGDPHAYIAFAFASDESIQYEGAYVDNVTIWAEPKPPVPVANPDVYQVSAGRTLYVAYPGVLSNDSGADRAFFTSLPAHGSFVWDMYGGFEYDPNDGFVGTDSCTYYASNLAGDSGPATVTFNVLPDVAPNASDDIYTVIRDRTNNVPPPRCPIQR